MRRRSPHGRSYTARKRNGDAVHGLRINLAEKLLGALPEDRFHTADQRRSPQLDWRRAQ